MLTKIGDNNNQLYAVYYVVFGSLAGEDRLVREYLWDGPYKDMKAAVDKAKELKESHQNDDSFIVRTYAD